MSTGNPLEQLRRRMQSHATPTAFAALAEEHRRAGRLAEAVAVCREGLERYPAYVSARVTLGRALLDSGDAPGAVTELEHAVAQSPDNLAAARALETARAALGDVPWPPALVAPAATTAADLPLRTPDDDSVPSSVIASALGAGPDGPQEFGLAPDWSLPDVLPPLPVAAAPPALEDDVHTEALDAHAESPTTYVTPAHPQGEEPAGIWPVPADQSTADPAAVDGAHMFSWSLDPPSSGLDAGQAVEERSDPDERERTIIWDAQTIEAPVADIAGTDDVAATSPGQVPVDADGVLDAPTDDEPSPFWTGYFGGEAVAEDAAPFAGWGEEAPPTAPEADRSPWADEDVADGSAAWNTPDGPSATWALSDLREADGADATPFQGTLDVEDTSPEPFASITDASELAWADSPVETSAAPLTEMLADTATASLAAIPDEPSYAFIAEPLDEDLETLLAGTVDGDVHLPADVGALPADVGADLKVGALDPALTAATGPSPAEAVWSGSVKSAMGEVFALAGHGESLEPPAHPSPMVREAMADAAVDAALEDAALREDAPPVLASLEQMLAAVRARRAALSGPMDS
ncbi:Putative Zn-dependent protease, contains TPR repeats [Luteitalea pratensis]|uniref:Zn-dependent protease, contains TPR repeats n=1 Tax=Luteitalea pratensis TaxID=1855912 RepID=A0A143PQR0_LUTPR|nr:tetratricopeptide repeat protein [Luteitalea pratensis]AMY10935.1 Putative Zn-dependent protease, contains TPR repeats [Luteitalea pratensis]